MVKSVLMSMAFSVLLLSGCVKSQPDASTTAASSAGAQDNSKRITFIVGPLARSVTVAQVNSFVQTGDPNGEVAGLLRTGKVPLEKLRGQLSKSYELDLIQMDKILNSSIGIALLTRLGEAVHPHKSKETSVQAVRSAIILSLVQDNQLSPMEVLSNLPVDMDVEVLQILKLRDELSSVFGSAVL
ncbi:MAG: alpha/beta hydrolase [Betaproteobacteria bacterium]|nr:alpha/beta hydrolase [Betaproteobacteria bacterium]